MNMFRQAVHESLRQLGINPPKAIMAILVIGFSIFLVSEFLGPQASKVAVTVVPSLENSDPTNGSVPGWQLWLIQSIAWLGAFAVVFTLLLIWNAFRCVRVERATTANLRILADSADSADDQIKLVFRNSFSNPWYGISKCYAFGSVVRQYPTHDVDIVVQFDSLAQIHRGDDYAAADRAIGARKGDGPGTIWGRGGPVSVFSCRGRLWDSVRMLVRAR